MSDCIFCKIIKGEIPCAKIYENNDILAFVDIMPVNKGHTLVIPKEHHETLLDIPDRELSEVIKGVKTVAGAVKKATDAEGFNIQMNNYKAAGQVVPHAHFHIVPRFSDDGLRLWQGGKYEEGEIDKIKKKISSLIS